MLHHLIGRGIERKKVFWNNDDRKDFLKRLAALSFDGTMDIYAWALMPNHFHILRKAKNLPLSSSMPKMLTGYVVTFKGDHKRRGYLFQNRYKSIVCREDLYLEKLVRYILLKNRQFLWRHISPQLPKAP